MSENESCERCSGEYCDKHASKPCDCDVIDRHLTPCRLESPPSTRAEPTYDQLKQQLSESNLAYERMSADCENLSVKLAEAERQLAAKTEELERANRQVAYYQQCLSNIACVGQPLPEGMNPLHPPTYAALVLHGSTQTTEQSSADGGAHA
jgi:hypothetical protein